MGVLVLTGEATEADVAACSERPDLVVPSLRELGELLVAAHGGKSNI
ncbi:MAG: HAD hydrolase-like protein [Phycisphaerae bacterium]